LQQVCSIGKFLPNNCCVGEANFYAFLAYPDGGLRHLHDLIISLAQISGRDECAIYRPIELFGCSDEEFLQDRGELPLVFFNAKDGNDLIAAWLHGVPPNGAYHAFDAVICGGEVDWFMYFQYDFNAGVLGFRGMHGVDSVIASSVYPMARTATAACDEELVWPDGYSEDDREEFYCVLKAEFSS
jgi:hypothetical protein